MKLNCDICGKEQDVRSVFFTYVEERKTISVLCPHCLREEEIKQHHWIEENKFNRFEIMDI